MKTSLQIILFLVYGNLFGQEIIKVNDELINRLSFERANLELSDVRSGEGKIISLEKFFGQKNQTIVKNNKGTFILVDGTGRVYKANSKNQDTVYFQRIDSTHFYGYNGAAILFSYKDTLFSFGGEGYWRTNGQLRYFSEKNHEWDILPLNEEIPSINTLFYIDRFTNELFYVQAPVTNYATNEKTKDYVLYKLNLVNRQNTRLGVLNNLFSALMPTNKGYSFTPIKSLNGLLVNFDSNNQYLVDLKNNKVQKLNSIQLQKTYYGNSKGIETINTFEINNWLYFTKSNDPSMQLDSVRITMDDFTPMNTPFYEPETNINNLLAGLGLVIIIISSAFIYLYRKNKEIQLENSNEEVEIDGFKSIEIDLIEKIYKKTTDGKSYSVEDINSALGLSKKSLEIQKKIRTETINRINHRFKLKFNTEEDLIERVRLEEDRRFYKYIINEENGKKALGI